MIATWLILECLINCEGDVAAARRDGFSYERAIERDKSDTTLGSWDAVISSEIRPRAVAALRGRQFATRAACLTALKHALPVQGVDDPLGAVRIYVEQFKDYVLEGIWTTWNQSQYFACYHSEPVIR